MSASVTNSLSAAHYSRNISTVHCKVHTVYRLLNTAQSPLLTLDALPTAYCTLKKNVTTKRKKVVLCDCTPLAHFMGLKRNVESYKSTRFTNSS